MERLSDGLQCLIQTSALLQKGCLKRGQNKKGSKRGQVFVFSYLSDGLGQEKKAKT